MAELRAAQGQEHSVEATPTPGLPRTPAHTISTPAHTASTPAHPTTMLVAATLTDSGIHQPAVLLPQTTPETKAVITEPVKPSAPSADVDMDVDKPASS
jgi:hypothetical protein